MAAAAAFLRKLMIQVMTNYNAEGVIWDRGDGRKETAGEACIRRRECLTVGSARSAYRVCVCVQVSCGTDDRREEP